MEFESARAMLVLLKRYSGSLVEVWSMKTCDAFQHHSLYLRAKLGRFFVAGCKLQLAVATVSRQSAAGHFADSWGPAIHCQAWLQESSLWLTWCNTKRAERSLERSHLLTCRTCTPEAETADFDLINYNHKRLHQSNTQPSLRGMLTGFGRARTVHT